MHLSASHKSTRLPKRFPVGTTYVVEGHGGAQGQLRVFSRYVLLPGGRRINLTDDFGVNFSGPASPRAHRPTRAAQGTPRREKGGSGRVKKIITRTGTSRQHRR
ncbi:MAG: hypothetical protein WA652_07075 [Xanthobacteraceae bacterium]|jgi:hypothetical protein